MDEQFSFGSDWEWETSTNYYKLHSDCQAYAHCILAVLLCLHTSISVSAYTVLWHFILASLTSVW